MGLRFRKSINLGGGFRVNFSKSGIGWSAGSKLFRYTKKANGGSRTTSTIPGTGVSYVKEYGKKRAPSTQSNAPRTDVIADTSKHTFPIYLILIPIILVIAYNIPNLAVFVGIAGLFYSIYTIFRKNSFIKSRWILLFSFLLIITGGAGATPTTSTPRNASNKISSYHTTASTSNSSAAVSSNDSGQSSEMSSQSTLSSSTSTSDQMTENYSSSQAAASQPVASSSTNLQSDNVNNSGTFRWAVEDGYTWQNRAGHCHRISPGQSLPNGYHWQV